MARLFDDASSEYLYINQAVLAGEPFAAACWFNVDVDNLNLPLMTISTEAAPWEIYTLGAKGYLAGDYLEVATYSGSWTSARTSTGFTKNKWQHMTGIFVHSTSRRVFINGGSKGTDSTSQIIGAVNKTYIGASAGAGSTFSGMLGEAAIWDLSDWPGATSDDKADNFEKILSSLAKGFSPLFYPLGLVAYWPLIRGLNDRVGGYNLTASGTTVAAHPRIIQPCGVL